MRLLLWLLPLLCALSSPAHAAHPCPPTRNNHDWSAQCFEGSGAARRVKAQYVRQITPKKAGVALISIEENMELVAVDRRGRIVIPGIFFTGDFDYPTASGNRGRFTTAWRADKGPDKCGYFIQSTFKIIIPAVYDQCTPFHDGRANVCTNCDRYCTDEDCHDSVHVGGTGFTLGRDNKILATARLPTLDTICGGPGLAKIDKINRVLQCPPNPIPRTP